MSEEIVEAVPARVPGVSDMGFTGEGGAFASGTKTLVDINPSLARSSASSSSKSDVAGFEGDDAGEDDVA